MRPITMMQRQKTPSRKTGAALRWDNALPSFLPCREPWAARITAGSAGIASGSAVRVCGRNLFYRSGAPAQPAGITVEYDEAEQIFTVNGTTAGAGDVRLSVGMGLPLDAGTQITVRVEVVGGCVDGVSSYLFYSLFNSTNSKFLRNSSGTLAEPGVLNYSGALPSGSAYNFYIQFGGAYTFDGLRVRIQLEQGAELHSFEPYRAGSLTTPAGLSEGDACLWLGGETRILRSGGGAEVFAPQPMPQVPSGRVNILQLPPSGGGYGTLSAAVLVPGNGAEQCS